MVVGDDDEGAAGEYLGEHVASLERARAIDQDRVEVAELADPGELGGVQLMDDLVAGIRIARVRSWALACGSTSTTRARPYAATVWAASESVTIVLPTPPF